MLVLGPISGRQQAYVLLAEWVRDPRRPARDEALGEARRPRLPEPRPGHGADRPRWSGLPLGDVRRGLALCADRIARLDFAGSPTTWPRRCWTRSRLSQRQQRSRMFACFPGSTSTCSAMGIGAPPWPRSTPQAVVPGNNGMFLSTIVIHGEVVGTWKRTARIRRS